MIVASEPSADKPKHSITITRSKKSGLILSAEICPQQGTSYEAATNEFEAFLQKTLAEIGGAETSHEEVYLLFTTDKVSGEFCHSPHFSIREAPPEAPMPPQMLADFPVIVTFGYTSPPNEMLRRKRAHRAGNNIILLLNLLLQDRIFPLRSGPEWGIISEDMKGQSPTSKFFHKGYWFPGFDSSRYPLAATGMPAIAQIHDSHYYDALGKGLGDGFSIPLGLASHYDAFLRLDPSNREALLAAARHVQFADSARARSASYAHVALVSAVEVIAEAWAAHWADQDRCEACDRPIYALSKRYRAFLKTYANPGEAARKMYRLYYETRSGILHTGRFMRAESLGMWDFGMDASEETGGLQFLWNATKVAIINWMHDPFKIPEDAKKEAAL